MNTKCKLILKTILLATLWQTPLLANATNDEPNKQVWLKTGEELVLSKKPKASKSASTHRLRLATLGLGLNLKSHLDSNLSTAGLNLQTIQNRSDNNDIRLQPKRLWLNKCRQITKRLPGVSCELNHAYFLNTKPNDIYLGSAWGLDKIGALQAWDKSVGAYTTKVAVVDSGVEYLHPDLINNILINKSESANNKRDDDVNGYVDDYYGYDFVARSGTPKDLNNHGTHVAGIIGAQGNNRMGLAGVNWKVSILAVRVLDKNGAGTSERVAAGINYAISRKAHIINLSLGSPEFSQVLENSMALAAKAGILIVTAAGNDRLNNDKSPSYPANSTLSNVISVAATDWQDQLASFSNYGAKKVHIAAPGVDIASTAINGTYIYLSGTSMASPFVAGAAALLKSAKPKLSYVDIKNILLASVDPLPNLRGKVSSGGRLNLKRALDLAISKY